ncbi:uncharacterized protein PAC_06536 [Phialocephala subalpina]|uniref:Fungal N-terminal domain-containing protein n=1 Tax=Phialocephala subalpina TaxID=576137 RepID=A0A1L7WV53_9HELO|nr:uncharacterized protein PAC_06536 [Phialocephala subalpina]
MDPITLYGGLSLLTSSLATIVNVALDTKDGRKTLHSTLKELPILFDLLEEMREGVLKTEFLILCLTQRGLIPGFQRGHEGFSGLRKKLSGSDTFYSKLVDEEFKLPPRKEHRSLKEKFNLLNLDSLIQAVKMFKDSVLLLRHIAMDFKTHHLLYSQTSDQQAVLEELQTMHTTLKQPPNTINEDITCQGEPNGVIAEEATTRSQDHQPASWRGFRPNGTTRHSLGALSTISKRSNSLQYSSKTSESKLPEPEIHPTLFNVVVAIPDPGLTPETALRPQYICARTKLDTGSKRNLISERMVSQYRFEYLKRKLDRREERAVGDGKSTTSSECTIELTWYNTHDTMRSYRTMFYVVAPDIFDLLLGEEHFRHNGVPGYTTEYCLGFFELIKRPRGKSRNEKTLMKTAEAQAKEKLQHEREAVAASAHASPVAAISLGRPGGHSATTDVLRRTEQQIISDDRSTGLTPVPEQSPEQDRRDTFMTPAIATHLPKLAGKSVAQQEITNASTSLSPHSEISSTAVKDTGRQINATPSLNASVQTIEGSDPVTPNEERPEKELFLTLSSAVNGIDLVTTTKLEGNQDISTVPIAGSSLQTSSE